MFGYSRKVEDPKLDAVIERLLSEMIEYGPDSDEYQKCLAYLERVNTLKTTRSRQRVSPDQMAMVLGNLLGIVIIVAYEQKHVMTSKAKDFVLKTR